MKTLFAMLMLALTVSIASAQITVTQTTILNGPSSFTWHMPQDIATVDNGSDGANQTWSFMQATTQTRPVEIISPTGTPFESSFPGANLCQHSGPEGFGDYYYYEVAANAFYSLGYAITGLPEPTVWNPPAHEAPLPVTFGTAAWSRVTEITSEPFPGFTYTTRDSARRTVDAWGTVNTPYGSFQVIRVMGHVWNTTEITGQPPQTFEYITYSYIDVNGNAVISTASLPGDNDPGYTDGTLTQLEYGATSAEPARGPVANSFTVGQNYPNPFNPTTHLPISIDRPGDISVKIYNAVGQLVSQETFTLNSGQHSLPIDGSKWSSGHYFANVSVNGISQTTKMQLVK